MARDRHQTDTWTTSPPTPAPTGPSPNWTPPVRAYHAPTVQASSPVSPTAASGDNPNWGLPLNSMSTSPRTSLGDPPAASPTVWTIVDIHWTISVKLACTTLTTVPSPQDTITTLGRTLVSFTVSSPTTETTTVTTPVTVLKTDGT